MAAPGLKGKERKAEELGTGPSLQARLLGLKGPLCRSSCAPIWQATPQFPHTHPKSMPLHAVPSPGLVVTPAPGMTGLPLR